MSKVQMLRSLVKQRLTAAAEEIFGLFERTIAEYEEELCRSKEENERQRKLLDAVFNPQLRLHRADVQQLLVVKEEVPPEQQEWSSSVDQEDPEPPHIKEEQEELWISQEGEQLQGLEEADIPEFPFTIVPVESEDEEEEPQTSQLHQRLIEQMGTEADGEDCGGPEPARNSDPDTHLQPETDDSDDDWTETREYQSGFNFLESYEVPVSDSRVNLKPFRCSECGRRFGHSGNLKTHMRTHTGEKPFSCSVCGKKFAESGNLKIHMRIHTGEKPFGCSECGKRFYHKTHLKRHMITHTGEKPFSCLVCKKSFTQSGNLYTHMRSHTDETPFGCSEYGKRLGPRTHLKQDSSSDTGEKPFSCPAEKSFSVSEHLQTHMMIHTAETPFSCSVCDQRFTWPHQLRDHQCDIHQSDRARESRTEEKGEAEPPASSSAEQMETEADREDCGGPEPARSSDPEAYLQPETDDKAGESSELETEH
uniref:zinc finger protein 771-like n=1 Tax=Epinephelus lanceolatus TaxID=310571 RepID=UPI001444B479|nr:zinc finger protein 771-like [Epinephelus lanceolatus]